MQLASDYPPTTPQAKSCLKRQKTQFRQFISLNCSFKMHKRLNVSQKRRETLFLAVKHSVLPKNRELSDFDNFLQNYHDTNNL